MELHEIEKKPFGTSAMMFGECFQFFCVFFGQKAHVAINAGNLETFKTFDPSFSLFCLLTWYLLVSPVWRQIMLVVSLNDFLNDLKWFKWFKCFSILDNFIQLF